MTAGGLAMRGRVDARCGAGRVVLVVDGDSARLGVSSFSAARHLLRVFKRLPLATSAAGRLVSELPPTDVEVRGWRIATLRRGSIWPALPVFRGRV